MLDLVKKVLASHKSQMDRCREQYTRSLVGQYLFLGISPYVATDFLCIYRKVILNIFAFIALEQQCDEHRKRAKELKSKSQHLNNVLMTLTPVTSPPTAKRPRLTRAVSGPATVAATPAQTTHFTLPITQLTGIPLDKVLSAPNQSPLIGGYTVLTSPGGTELQSEGSNLTVLSTAAVPQGSAAPTIVKVVSPFQLVTLPTVGAGATVQNLTAPVGGAAGSTVVAVPVSTVGSLNTATVETVGPQAEAATEQRDDQKE